MADASTLSMSPLLELLFEDPSAGRRLVAPEGTGPEASRAAQRSVLIVEDNEDGAASLADLLILLGHRAFVAGTGEAGLSAVAAGAPDVILCDIGLPDMSGHEVIRRLRATPAGARVFAVALTGYAQPQDREAALAAGFDAHLPKPPPLDELEALLRDKGERR